jgi:hypothetical protein
MTTETLEELRERLLRQESVQQMIQMRAYEIYQMRGGKPGGEAQDWFHAEGEVLAFLLADESTRNDEQPETFSGESAAAPPEATVTRKPKARASVKSGESKAAKKKPSAKRASPKRSAGSKSATTRFSRKSKPEES